MCKHCGCGEGHEIVSLSGLPPGEPMDVPDIQARLAEIEREKEEERRKKDDIIKKNFVCRVCGCRKFHFVPTGSVLLGHGHQEGHYECDHCSTQFSDPESFSNPSVLPKGPGKRILSKSQRRR